MSHPLSFLPNHDQGVSLELSTPVNPWLGTFMVSLVPSSLASRCSDTHELYPGGYTQVGMLSLSYCLLMIHMTNNTNAIASKWRLNPNGNEANVRRDSAQWREQTVPRVQSMFFEGTCRATSADLFL